MLKSIKLFWLVGRLVGWLVGRSEWGIIQAPVWFLELGKKEGKSKRKSFGKGYANRKELPVQRLGDVVTVQNQNNLELIGRNTLGLLSKSMIVSYDRASLRKGQNLKSIDYTSSVGSPVMLLTLMSSVTGFPVR